jgi:hypothetical protein
MRGLAFAAILVATIVIVSGLVLQLGQKPIYLHSGSSPYSARTNFLVEHDSRYQIAYQLHHCEGTEFTVAYASIGGLSAPLPHEFQLLTASRASETGTTKALPLYYGNWQVLEVGNSADCTWTMSVKPVLF